MSIFIPPYCFMFRFHNLQWGEVKTMNKFISYPFTVVKFVLALLLTLTVGAGAGDVRNARVVLGGNPRTWVTVSFVPGWPEPVVDLDPRILERVDDLVATQLDYFYSFREDLSFTAD